MTGCPCRYPRLAANERNQPLALTGVHVPRFAADERLVRVDFVPSLPPFRPLSSGMARRMRCSMNHAVFCVTPSDRAISWLLTPFLRVGDDPDAGQPLVQAEGRVLENGAGLEREFPLRVAGLALPTVAAGVEVDRIQAALRAANAVAPAARDQVFPAVGRVSEEGHRVEQGWQGPSWSCP